MKHIALLFVILVSACTPNWTPVSYKPQKLETNDPRDVAKSVIMANTSQGCVTDVSINEMFMTVKFVCAGGYIGNTTVRFEQIGGIVLQQGDEWYQVKVQHKGGTPDFQWTSKSLQDMQKLADALVTMAQNAEGKNG